jgi:hypothetical protein
MANPWWGLTNYVVTGALSATYAETTMPATNLATVHGAASEAWQTPAGRTTAAFMVDAGASMPWRILAFFRSNLNTNALVRWRLSDNEDMSDPLYDTGNINARIVPGIGQSVHIMPSEITARYVRCDVINASNPDGFLNIALAYAGPATEMLGGVSYSTQFGHEERADDYETRGGQEYRELLAVRRRWDLSIETLRQSEIEDWAFDMDRTCRDGRNILFILNPESMIRASRDAVFGRVKPGGLFGYRSYLRRTWAATVTERL